MPTLDQLLALKSELESDPLGRGYAGMTDQQAADDLNDTYRTANVDELTGSQVMNAIDKAEFNGLTNNQKGLVWDLLHLGTLNPFGIEADLFVDTFGAGSQTITNLAALRTFPISRARELGLPTVRPGEVDEARNF